MEARSRWVVLLGYRVRSQISPSDIVRFTVEKHSRMRATLARDFRFSSPPRVGWPAGAGPPGSMVSFRIPECIRAFARAGKPCPGGAAWSVEVTVGRLRIRRDLGICR